MSLRLLTFRLLPWAACLLAASSAFADVVTLKDGRRITGTVEFGISSQVRVRIGEKSQMIATDDILSIQFDPIEGPGPVTSVGLPPVAAPPVAMPANAAAQKPPAAAKPVAPAPAAKSITLPPGTEIAVRTVDLIDSRKTEKNKEYSGSLDDPVEVDGVTVIPVNANAVLRVAEVQSSGITRRASLSLTLVAVIIDGHRIEVKTASVDSKSGSQAKQTAIGAGAGAGVGAAVGAAAGGAVGAGIGAGVGAAAGTAAAVIKGKPVEIKPETRFTYKLSEPAVVPQADREQRR